MSQQLIQLGNAPNDGTGTPAREAGEMINENFAELYGGVAHDRLDISAPAFTASFRDDGSGNLGWYVGAAGAADGSQIKAGVVNRTTGIASFPIGLTNQMFWTDGLVDPGTVTTDATRGTLQFRNSYAGTTIAGDIINGLSFSGAGSSNRRRAMIASVQDTASLPPTALVFYVNGSTVVGQDSVAERMRISSQGNVGIGTTAPSSRLHVRPATDVNLEIGTVSGALRMEVLNDARAAYVPFRVQASDILLNPAGGNVGIGASIPVCKLHIANAVDSSQVLVSGVSKGVRIVTAAAQSMIEGVDQTGIGSYQPLIIGGSTVTLVPSLSSAYCNGNWAPTSDNNRNLGSSSLRWGVVYAGTGTINTSDAREKTDVRPFAAAEIAAARDILAEIGIFQWLASIEEKGEALARLHVGMTVQRAIEIMEGHGLDPWRYGFLCRDQITRKVKVMQTQTVQATEDAEEVYTEIEIRDGVPVRVEKIRAIQRPLESLIAVVDESGQPVTRTSQNEDGSFTAEPVMHPVPVMVDREVEVEIDEPDGDRLGFRPDQLALFLLRGLLARVDDQEA